MGASAGGITALRSLVGGLRHDFPAPILVVQHIGNRRSILPGLLTRSGPLPAAHATPGEALRPGRIYVAPPDCHLVVEGDRVHLNSGPKENYTRPAIDPLFRSVALSHGPAAVGVILSGGLDDGTSGLQAIRMCGGTAIVQDPQTAEEPSMPASAARYVAVDHVVPVEAMPPLLMALAREGPPTTAAARPYPLAHEHALPDMKGDPMENLARIAAPSSFVCPECHGALWQVRDAVPTRYRCYTGHAYTLRTLRAAQGEGVDAALWNALRALEEKQALLKALAAAEGDAQAAAKLERSAEEALEVAHRLRALIEAQPKDPAEETRD